MIVVVHALGQVLKQETHCFYCQLLCHSAEWNHPCNSSMGRCTVEQVCSFRSCTHVHGFCPFPHVASIDRFPAGHFVQIVAMVTLWKFNAVASIAAMSCNDMELAFVIFRNDSSCKHQDSVTIAWLLRLQPISCLFELRQ